MEDTHDDVVLEMSPTGKAADRTPIALYDGASDVRLMATRMLLVTQMDNPKEALFLDGKRFKPTKDERAAVTAEIAAALAAEGQEGAEPTEVADAPVTATKPRKVANASKAKPKRRSLIARIRKRHASAE